LLSGWNGGCFASRVGILIAAINSTAESKARSIVRANPGWSGQFTSTAIP
jgi:hypothetical protein